MTRKLFIALVIFVLTLAGKLAFDLHLYYSGGVNHHLTGPAIVLVCLIGCSWLAGWLSTPMWLLGYWALFDSLWGLFTGNGAFYLGTTAWLDILQNQYPALQVAKYVLAAGATTFYVIKARRKMT